MLVNILIFAYSLHVASTITTCITNGVFKQLLLECCHYSNIQYYSNLSCDLQVMWDPETFPARASSLSFKPWCATQTATVTTSHVWRTRHHHTAHAQGIKGIPIYHCRLFTIASILSHLRYRKSQCTLSVTARVQLHLLTLYLLDLVTVSIGLLLFD